jgi:hypothetical protein
MRWQFFVAYGLHAFDWIGLPKRASVPVFALFFAALISTVPLNAQQFASKSLPFDSGHEWLNAPPGIPIGLDSARAVVTNNNQTHRSRVADNNDDRWNSQRVEGSRPALLRIGYFQLPAFIFRQVVDQICSYRFTLY